MLHVDHAARGAQLLAPLWALAAVEAACGWEPPERPTSHFA